MIPEQQLVARIKRSSKYAYQAPEGGWFDVRVVPDMGYGLRGNNNNYRFGDIVFGVRLDDGTVIDITTGKSERPALSKNNEFNPETEYPGSYGAAAIRARKATS